MKPELLHILQHSLGVDQYGRGNQYRNRFVTGPESDDFEKCRELCVAGFLHDHGAMKLAGGMHVFTVTDAGRNAVRTFSPQPPKISRSKKRYLEYLRSECGLNFGDWLKWKQAQTQ